ncbi:hypothetical protein AAF712_004838 [Marasmius tenuissimus]|uniref:Uncharacterized protein n=1 Tax=Marasmius tenuissimus TaxID=585030 RepID=A0ABR3A5A4_9AGAR
MSEMSFMQFRNDSGSTDDSPFGSPLNTPADENAVMLFDKLGEHLVDEYRGELVRHKEQSLISDSSISTIHLADISKGSMKTDGHQHEVYSQKEEQSTVLDDTNELSPSVGCLSVDCDLTSLATPIMESSNSTMTSSPDIDFSSHQRASSLYSLPNDPISISPAISQAQQLSQSSTASDSLDGSAVKLRSPEEDQVDPQGPIEDSPQAVSSRKLPSNSKNSNNPIELTALLIPAQVLCFLPWCIAVGCALLLFPKHLEHVVFTSGYYYPNAPSPSGIHRFAHLAEYAIPHVMTFLAFLVLSVWFNMPLGLGLATLAFSQGMLSWQDFREDLSIPLGEDDRMAIYWILKRYAFGEGCWGMRKADDGYFITTGGGPEGNEVEEDD